MKGAIPVPPRKTTIPMTSRTSTMGMSHHFLLWRRKSQNSPMGPRVRIRARWAKSFALGLGSAILKTPLELLEVTLGVGFGIVGDPIGARLAIERALERIAPQEAHQCADGEKDEIISDCQNNHR